MANNSSAVDSSDSLSTSVLTPPFLTAYALFIVASIGIYLFVHFRRPHSSPSIKALDLNLGTARKSWIRRKYRSWHWPAVGLGWGKGSTRSTRPRRNTRSRGLEGLEMLPTTVSDADPEDIRHSRATSVSSIDNLVRLEVSPTRKRSSPTPPHHQHQDAILIDFEEDLVDLSLPTTPSHAHIPQPPSASSAKVGYPLVQVQPDGDGDLLDFRPPPSRIPSNVNLVDLSPTLPLPRAQDPLGVVRVPVPVTSQFQPQPQPEPEPTQTLEEPVSFPLPLPLPENPFLSPDDPPESPISPISLPPHHQHTLPHPQHPILIIDSHVEAEEDSPFEVVSPLEAEVLSPLEAGEVSPSEPMSTVSPFEDVHTDADMGMGSHGDQPERDGIPGKERMAREIDRIVSLARGRKDREDGMMTLNGERHAVGEWTDMQVQEMGTGMDMEGLRMGGHDTWAVPAFRDGAELEVVEVEVGEKLRVEERRVEEQRVEEEVEVPEVPLVKAEESLVKMEESLVVEEPLMMEKLLKVEEPLVVEEPSKMEEVVEEEDATFAEEIEETSVLNAEESVQKVDATLVDGIIEVMEPELAIQEPTQKIDELVDEMGPSEEEMDLTMVEEHLPETLEYKEMKEDEEEPLVQVIEEIPDIQVDADQTMEEPLVRMDEVPSEENIEPTQESTQTSELESAISVPEVHSLMEDIDTLLAITPSASINVLEFSPPEDSNNGGPSLLEPSSTTNDIYEHNTDSDSAQITVVSPALPQISLETETHSPIDTDDPELPLITFSLPYPDEPIAFEHPDPDLLPLPVFNSPPKIKVEIPDENSGLKFQTPTPPASPPLSALTVPSPLSSSPITVPSSTTSTRPAWSLRASDAPALGLSAQPGKESSLTLRKGKGKENKAVTPSSSIPPSPSPSPFVLSTSLPGSFTFSPFDEPISLPEVSEENTPSLLSSTVTVTRKGDEDEDTHPSLLPPRSPSPTSSTQVTVPHPHPSTYTHPRPGFTRSPLDIALAMQLRPGLGAGADAAWMVRFLMAMFGWFTVLVGGSGDY